MKIDRDKIGIITSATCAVHCFMFPLLVVILPTFASLLKAQWIHGIVLGLAILPALESLILDGCSKSRWILALSGFVGLSLMLHGLVSLSATHDLFLHEESIHAHFSEMLIEHKYFLIGGLILGIAHAIKLFSKNNSNTCQC